jgi:hypothetical protein
MSPEAQRIAIAEACGWTKRVFDHGKCIRFENPMNQCLQSLDTIPDYLNDLNAVHEAEKQLNYEQRVLYICALIESQQPGFNSFPDSTVGKLGCFALLHATAAQRAEAFLKTLGLWKEEAVTA